MAGSRAWARTIQHRCGLTLTLTLCECLCSTVWLKPRIHAPSFPSCFLFFLFFFFLFFFFFLVVACPPPPGLSLQRELYDQIRWLSWATRCVGHMRHTL